jgi:hypothetical protein
MKRHGQLVRNNHGDNSHEDSTPLEEYLYYCVWRPDADTTDAHRLRVDLFRSLFLAPICEEVAHRMMTIAVIDILITMIRDHLSPTNIMYGPCIFGIRPAGIIMDSFIFASAHNIGIIKTHSPGHDNRVWRRALFLYTFKGALVRWGIVIVVGSPSYLTTFAILVLHHSFRNWMVALSVWIKAQYHLSHTVDDFNVLRLVAETRYQKSWIPQGKNRRDSLRSLVRAIGYKRLGETPLACKRRQRKLKQTAWKRMRT